MSVKPKLPPSPTIAPSAKPATHQRNATTAVSINQQPLDLLPHEQDESASSQASPPRKIMKQAAADVAHGLKDTDRGVEIGKTYAKQKI